MTDSEKIKDLQAAKKIEEMTHMVRGAVCNGKCSNCSKCCEYHTAEALYNAGYRKVDNIGDFTVYGFKKGYVKALVERDEEIKKLKAELAKELTDHEAFIKNMKNVLEIEKEEREQRAAIMQEEQEYLKNREKVIAKAKIDGAKEFAEKLKIKADKGAAYDIVTYKYIERDYTITESKLAELLKEYENEQEKQN